jgi:hypothetical protein
VYHSESTDESANEMLNEYIKRRFYDPERDHLPG